MEASFSTIVSCSPQQASLRTQTPDNTRLTRSDVHFPLTTPRKKVQQMPVLAQTVTQDGQSSRIPRLRADDSSHYDESGNGPEMSALTTRLNQDLDLEQDVEAGDRINKNEEDSVSPPRRPLSIQDLPEELHKRILDYILGDLQPVNAASTATGLSHRMRHPRRKAVSELALISPKLRVMVQERIYRHIKIKGTREGLRTSREWFEHPSHSHLAAYVRHIEYWIPVWSDKPSMRNMPPLPPHGHPEHRNVLGERLAPGDDFGNLVNDYPNLTYPLSSGTASLESIFQHIAACFEDVSVLTLEGGHCKNSKVIEHFAPNLFSKHMKQKHLRILPSVRVLSIKGAWNIMRTYQDWRNIQNALPLLHEAHIGYAKPVQQAYATINEFLLCIPRTLRHVDISLDSMFSKEDNILSSSTAMTSTIVSNASTLTGTSRLANSHQISSGHICEHLGLVAPRLESLSFTGKVCSCLFTSAISTLLDSHTRTDPNLLKSIKLTVKSCCRQRIIRHDPATNTTITEELGGFMADSAGIHNLAFIANFERLVSSAIRSLKYFPSLTYIKIRYIDLDSPCQQLNPYWCLDKSRITGLWSSLLLEQLKECRPEAEYVELCEGIVSPAEQKRKEIERETDVFSWTGSSVMQNSAGQDAQGTGNAMYPRTIPRGIHVESYRALNEGRA